ncbi:hypothetical protein Q3G72_015650 [Acer saccharum]|nr:hypothetical protein Q3G72_015650 [Acer saccharum]
MATSSKLIENMAMLSSPRGIQNHRSNLRGFKSVKFRAASNFSGFKVESFIGKSTSATIKNNNVVAAASFDSKAQQSPSTTLTTLIQEAVIYKKILNWAFPAAVMAASLLLGMMMIDCRKRALVFPGKYSLSLSSSSSFAESETQPKPVKLDLVPVYIVLCGVVVSVVFSVKLNDAYSVGLLFDQTLQRDLHLIRKALYQCDSSGWGTVLEGNKCIPGTRERQWNNVSSGNSRMLSRFKIVDCNGLISVSRNLVMDIITLKLLRMIGLGKVIVKWINEESNHISDVGLELEEVLTVIKSMGGVVVQYVPRKANQVDSWTSKGKLLVLIPFGYHIPNKISVEEGGSEFCIVVEEEDRFPVTRSWLEGFLGLSTVDLMDDKVGDGVRVQLFSRDLDQRNIAGGQCFWKERKGSKVRRKGRVNLSLIKHNPEEMTSLTYDVGTSKSLSVSDCREGTFLNAQVLRKRRWALERGNLRGPSDPLLAESEFFGSSDFPMVNWNIKKRNKDGCFIGRELVQNLAVTSSSISKKRRSTTSNLMRIHNLKTRSISVGETRLHHKLEEEVWNLDDEIVKVFERGLALVLDFNGRKKEISELIARRDVKNDNRFLVLVKTLVAKHRSIVS